MNAELPSKPHVALDLGRDGRVMKVKYLEGAGVQFASSAECAQVNMGFLNEATGGCHPCTNARAHTHTVYR